MATPTGKLLFTSQQDNQSAKTRLKIGGAIAAVVLVVLLLARASYFAPLFAMIPALFALPSLRYALRDDKKIEIHQDGVIFRRVKDGSVTDEATWDGISNITWTAPQSNAAMMGGAAFGLVGMAVGAAIDSMSSSRSGTVYDYGKANKFFIAFSAGGWAQKVVFDSTFNDFSGGLYYLLDASAKAWSAATLADLKAGKTVKFGNVEVSPAAVTDGKRQFLWKDITGVELTDRNAGLFAIRGREAGKDRPTSISRAFGHRGAALRLVVNDYRQQISA